MNKEEEIKKEEKLRDKRTNNLTTISLITLGAAIVATISFQIQPEPRSDLPALVLVPLLMGATVGFIFSIFTVRFGYETTKRVIEIQSALDEMKNISENLGDESPIMILKKRLAMGKITLAEYDSLKSAIDS